MSASCLQVIYSVLQCIVLLFLILRLIWLCEFHPRLGLIARTITRALPILLHLLVCLVVIVVMTAAALVSHSSARVTHCTCPSYHHAVSERIADVWQNPVSAKPRPPFGLFVAGSRFGGR